MRGEAKQFRQAVARLGRRGRGKRYPRELREQALAILERSVEAGWSLASVADELGVPPITLSRWAKAGNNGEGRGGFRPVSVVESRESFPRQHIVVVTPGGVRVEGLDLAGALKMVRVLG